MGDYGAFIAALVTLLVGLAVGKAWERYKLREGRWIDRRRARESPHYILGLNFMVSGQLDRAIDELNRAARIQPEALEIEMILGNLYREKGQVGRAITIHQGLLQRPKLAKLEHAYVLLCLGLDYKRGGFVDRALEAFQEVLRLDPQNPYALVNLQKLHEEQHQWREARDVRQRLVELTDESEQPRHRQILAFLETELGRKDLKQLDYTTAGKRFRAAIDLDDRIVPAYLGLGDVQMYEGDVEGAARSWERVADVAPERAYLAFERLASLPNRQEHGERFERLCRSLIASNPQDWRARLALGLHLGARGSVAEALDLLLEALSHNPHALAVHQAVWRLLLDTDLRRDTVERYTDVTRQSIFYLDPHVCQRCHYRSTELLWQCPHCHEWDSFVEERIAPAQEDVGPVGTELASAPR